MEFPYKPGTKILLELENETFTGVVHGILNDGVRVCLKDVKDVRNSLTLRGFVYFFTNKIKNVTRIPTDSGEETNSESDNSEESSSDIENSYTVPLQPLIFTTENWSSIENSVKNVKIIDEKGELFFSAIEDFNNQSEIAIMVEDCEFGRHNIPSIMSIYSPASKVVYVFDLVFMRRIEKELQNILLSKKMKILFDSKNVCDHLLHQHQIDNMDHIFDVLVAFLVSNQDEKPLNLVACIKKCFKIPENFFNEKAKYKWLSRPLSRDCVIFSAKKVVFLYKLYETLLHDHLLRTFYQTCRNYSRTYTDLKDRLEVFDLMSKNDLTADYKAQETDPNLSFSYDQIKERLNS